MGKFSEFLKEKLNVSLEENNVKRIPFLKLAEGESAYIKFLGMDERYITNRRQHWLGRKSITCLQTFKEECPVCELVEKSASKNASQYKARDTVLAIAWLLKKENGKIVPDSETPLVLVSLSKMLIGTIDDFIDEGAQVFDEEGVVLKITKTNNRYNLISLPKSIIVSNKALAKIANIRLEELDIMTQIPRPKEEDIKAFIRQISEALGVQIQDNKSKGGQTQSKQRPTKELQNEDELDFEFGVDNEEDEDLF